MGQKTSADPNKPSVDGMDSNIGVGVNYASVANTSNILKELEERDLSKKEFIKLKKIWDKKSWRWGNSEIPDDVNPDNIDEEWLGGLS